MPQNFKGFIKINMHTVLERLFKRYGSRGLLLYLKLKNKKKRIIEFSYPNEFKEPIYLRTGTTDFSTFMEVIFGKAYEFPLNFIPEVIIDCGANIGLTSIYLKNKFPDARVFAVEPEKENFKILTANLSGYDNTTLYNNGIWNKKTMLKIEDSGLGEWGFMVTETNEMGPNTIPAISIKDIMHENNINIIDILKIDIEGSEKELFESGYEYWLPRTKIIIIELHDRLRMGASQSFFNALIQYKFSLTLRGQNIFCFFKN